MNVAEFADSIKHIPRKRGDGPYETRNLQELPKFRDGLSYIYKSKVGS